MAQIEQERVEQVLYGEYNLSLAGMLAASWSEGKEICRNSLVGSNPITGSKLQ